jgi:hypothetical protein
MQSPAGAVKDLPASFKQSLQLQSVSQYDLTRYSDVGKPEGSPVKVKSRPVKGSSRASQSGPDRRPTGNDRLRGW